MAKEAWFCWSTLYVTPAGECTSESAVAALHGREGGSRPGTLCPVLRHLSHTLSLLLTHTQPANAAVTLKQIKTGLGVKVDTSWAV